MNTDEPARNNFSKDGENYNGINELAENIYNLNKLFNDYSDDPIQLEKELNNFRYTKGEDFDRLSEHFNSAKKPYIPLRFIKDYFTIASHNIWKSRKHGDEKKKSEIERSPLEGLIEKIKQDRLLTGVSKRKLTFQKTKKTKLSRPEFPDNLKWEQISIRFLNGDDVQVTTGELTCSSSAKLMGFQDEKTKKPNKQWDLLKLLSVKGGCLNWENNHDLDIKGINRIKKQKQGLSERLIEYFDISGDSPFFEYKKEKGYNIKIQLIPEIGINVQKHDRRSSKEIENDGYGNEEDEDYF